MSPASQQPRELLPVFQSNFITNLLQCQPLKSKPQALYIHIPFCFHKCHYCDFYSIPDDPGQAPQRQQQFTQRLIAEIELRSRQIQLLPRTVFVGGGTPTFLLHKFWDRILQALHRLGITSRIQEFTVEANPETVNLPLLELLVKGGVNRISIGAQTFQPHLLKTLERWHQPASVQRAVEMARQAGVAQISLDMIFAIPGQSLAELDDDLDQILALRPDHLSCYGLTYEPNTALTKRLEQGQFNPLEEELEQRMYERVIQRLATAGFEHYEVSNWARIDATTNQPLRCQHNLVYWYNESWLGVGPGAASHLQGHRWKNQPNLGRYLESGFSDTGEPPIIDYEHLPPERRLGEELMLGLRLREGVRLDWLASNLPSDDPRCAVIDQMLSLDMMEKTTQALRLTHRGLLVADSVISKLI